jgi:hypothetical protein
MVRDGLLCFVAPKGFKRGGSAAAGALAFSTSGVSDIAAEECSSLARMEDVPS